ncbi:hypothetical protein [Aneurinibacillus sp. REN35]|uniref:hypothetical protein n=1 Tax=Aneurinibacillus sp. REN35 TaxID=3237286 RepID=UPI003527ADB1
MPYTVMIQEPTADFLTITNLLQELGYRQKTLNDYSYFIEHRENKAHVAIDKTITFMIHEQISLSALEVMRRIIIELKNRAGGTIADGDYHIGYLADGTKTSLFRNWERWVSFLHAARFQTIEGSHVRVYDTAYRELGVGVLLAYVTQEDAEGIIRITNCDLKTEEGVRAFSAEPYMIVEATGEWVDPQEVEE